MISRTPIARRAARIAVAGVSVTLAASGLAGLAAAGSAAAAVPAATPGAQQGGANPYSPQAGHSYRNGVVPTLTRLRQMKGWSARQASTHLAADAAKAGTGNLVTYGGGVRQGVGVMTSPEKVYLVFWGSQWGSASQDSHGIWTLSNDPSGEAPYLQALFGGLGRTGDSWSGVMTQYCQGVPYNSVSCPANSFHVSTPGASGALAGVWADTSAPEPQTANGVQLGQEAVAAAQHFGLTTDAQNQNVQYVILSATGTDPDNWQQNGFCAWHDDTQDPQLSGGGPVNSPLDLAFTNMPYVTDAGTGCGQNFKNAGTAGLLDGVSIVEGHEYAETVTDPYPATGWTVSDPTSSWYLAEVGDLCAWNSNGGQAIDLKLPTGTFAMQSIWGNDANGGHGGCQGSHAVVANTWVVNGGFETGTLAHWTASGSASVVTFAKHSGKYSARLGNRAATKANSSLTQKFTANGGTSLTFWYNVSCPTSVSRSWATATLTDNSTSKTTIVLQHTCKANSGWQKITVTVVQGRSYTLTLSTHDPKAVGQGTYTLFDDVVNS